MLYNADLTIAKYIKNSFFIKAWATAEAIKDEMHLMQFQEEEIWNDFGYVIDQKDLKSNMLSNKYN